MLRHACGYAIAIGGHDTRAIQAFLDKLASLLPRSPNHLVALFLMQMAYGR
jgi:hypothetical protein